MKKIYGTLTFLVLVFLLQGFPMRGNAQNIDTAYAVADSVCSADSFLLIAKFSSPVAVEATWDGPNISAPLVWQDTAIVDTLKWAYTTGTTNVYQFNIQLRDASTLALYQTKYVSVFIGARPNGGFGVDSVCVGDVTNFTNTSTAYGSETMTYAWDFGDLSGTSTLEDPTYTYGAPGNYPVQLVVTSSYGCTDTVTHTAYVFPYPTNSFNSPDGCEGQDITLSRDTTGLNLLGWRWKFGDGSFHLGDTAVAYRYATADTFSVTLIDTNVLGCVDSTTQTLIVHPKPVSAVSFPFDTVCAYNSITFTRTTTSVDPILTWWWRFTSRSPREGTNARTQTYTGPGLKTVILIDTTIYGCSDTVTDTFYVMPLPEPDFSWDTVCAEHPTTLTYTGSSDSLVTGRAWIFPDGDTLIGGTNVQHTFDTGGIYRVVMVDTTINGCYDSSVQFVEVYPQPIPLIFADSVCFGDSTTLSRIPLQLPLPVKNGFLSGWSWKVEDSVYHDTYRFKHRFSGPGKFAVTLIDTVAITGCVDSITDTIVVWRLPEPAFAHDTVCYGDSTTLTHTSLHLGPVKAMDDSLIRGWTWFVEDSVYHNVNPVRHQFLTPGEYRVTLIDTTLYGCLDSISDTVLVRPLPTPDFVYDSACLTHPVTMERNDTTGMLLSGWTWVLDDTIAYSGQLVQTHVFASAGVHNIRLVDTTIYGCVAYTEEYTEVYDLPAPSFTHDSVCFGDSTLLRTESVFGSKYDITTGYTWFIEDSVYHRTPADDRELLHLFSTPGLHIVTLVDTTIYGCVDSISDTVFVFPWPAPGYTADTACFMDPSTLVHLDTAAAPSANWRWVLDDTLVFFDLDTLVWTFANPGLHSVQLIDTNIWGCVDSISGFVLVHPRPVVSMGITDPDTFCVDEAGISLNTGVPAGGSYTGNGVNTFLQAFFPGLAGAGDHVITYTYTDPLTGCPWSDSVYVHVNALPFVTMDPLTPICADYGPLTLYGGSPSGGTYSGAFVNSGVFDTDSAGAGTYRIMYYYTDPVTGCVNRDSSDLVVYPLPVVTLAPQADVCADNGLLVLSGGAPAQGTFTGDYVNAGSFDVASAGPGTYDIWYVYEDTLTLCRDSAMQTLTVHANPVVTIIKDDTICLGESVTLQATGALTYLWGDGETTASIDVSPSTSMTYHVTGTDEHGCTATD
ncbi:MAG TPA: PKD domain-containing protein, partial [Bacteroidales bacterium]|nr:PKD domain-containing protein [Bacteroidales bacterium]